MCGIAGYFSKTNEISIDILQAMMHSQAHRGPDAEGYKITRIDDIYAALGHRRLSIIDVAEHANQPMHYAGLSIVYNGEVYNYAEIRKELIADNYKFETASDTEVVLKSFHRWGIAAINKFRGMFAFCITDERNKKAYLVRDRAGVKPLYYYHDTNILMFSSEVKSFKYHPRFTNKISDEGMSLYFQYGYVPAPWSIYDGARKLRPGHYIEYDFKSDSLIEKPYWQLTDYYQLPKFSASEAELTAELKKILTESFMLRMISDVPVGVLLSGGIDSTLVAAMVQSQSKKPIETFTMGFSKKSFDESHYARKIADYLGTKHHEKLCTWHEAESVIPLIPKMYDEPFADSSAIPTALISQFVKQNVTVILSGDGGDELFCGYGTYLTNHKRFNRIQKLPFKNTINAMLNMIPDPIMPFYRLHHDYYDRYMKFKSIIGSKCNDEKYDAIIKTFNHYDLKKMVNKYDFKKFTLQNAGNIHDIEKMMLTDFNKYLPDDLMVKVDRATMYYSLEGREPLLDHKILEFAAQIPIEMKKNKLILKNILSKYVPKQYFERPKHGFGVPINAWLRNELNYLVEKYLNPEKIKKQDLFDHRYINKLVHAFKNSKTGNFRIWTLLMFQMWYEENFNDAF